MTSDPNQNYFLRKYSGKLDDPMATVARNIMLFQLLSKACRGVRSNQAITDSYIEKSGFFKISSESAKNASRLGAAQFDYFDYEALAHLCSGSDYLFGKNGALIKYSMSKGSGELAISYNPKNLYLTVRPLLPD